jgi:hypothetical protein
MTLNTKKEVNDYFNEAAIQMRDSAKAILSDKSLHHEALIKFAEGILKASNTYLKQKYIEKH